MARKQIPREAIFAYWERCNDLIGPIRWWRPIWPSDSFDILTEEALQVRLKACLVLGLLVHEGLPEERAE